jgi:hypothetical protein
MENYSFKTHITLLIQPEKLLKPAHTMPPVSAIWLLNRGYWIGRWDIDGYFNTKRGIEFLNDAIARFITTYGQEATRPAPTPSSSPDFAKETILHLKEFVANLDSLKRKQANKVPLQKVAETNFDETFWSMKLWVERQLSQNRIPTVAEIQAIGEAYSPHKERSTIRAKARSIYRWYAARGFEPTPDKRKRTVGDKPMTRKEATKVATQTKVAKAKGKFETAVNILKAKGERISCRSVAKIAQISTNTAAKYLRELRAQGAI